jgi:general secretion pathway protein C
MAVEDFGDRIRCDGQRCTIKREVIDRVLSDTTSLATAARFVPSIRDGRPNGFKLYAIRPTSIFARLGFQNGDTIKAINGNSMDSPDKALEVYTKLRHADRLSIDVERRGELVILEIVIQ